MLTDRLPPYSKVLYALKYVQLDRYKWPRSLQRPAMNLRTLIASIDEQALSSLALVVLSEHRE